MNRKKKVIISVVLFVVIFGGLLLTATFFDLDVSMILTKKALADHTYYTNDPFGALFETVGSIPIYFMLGFAFHILFWYAYKNFKGFKEYAVLIFTTVASVVAYYITAQDTLDYIKKHLGVKSDEMYLSLIYLFFAIVGTLAGLFVVRNFSDESIKKLGRFAVATLVLCAVPAILINLIIKEPVGRIRFRAMNMYPDNPDYGFAKFARWYEVNGQWLSDDVKRELFGTADALKSFPSGHTSSAGAVYGLTMLIDALGIKDKKKRAFLWIFPIVFTGTVAVSRIVVGAHFFSDVLVGGTISFVTMIIVREIFICKGENFKSLIGKN